MQKKQKITLEDLEKKQVYTVPDAYFADLPANIRRRVNGVQNADKPAISWIKYSVSLASMCLILLAGYFWFSSSQTQNTQQLISEVAYTEIVDYLEAHELSQYDIMEAASEAEVTFDSQFFQETDINPDLLIEEADTELLQEYI
jgi:hypothetical protein